jgi:hypothetical protein
MQMTHHVSSAVKLLPPSPPTRQEHDRREKAQRSYDAQTVDETRLWLTGTVMRVCDAKAPSSRLRLEARRGGLGGRRSRMCGAELVEDANHFFFAALATSSSASSCSASSFSYSSACLLLYEYKQYMKDSTAIMPTIFLMMTK